MRLICVLLPLLLMTVGVRAEDDPQRGKELYAACAACHGAGGEGNQSLNAPRLTHLTPVYIVAQLQKFKAGYRGGNGASDSSRQMAATLSMSFLTAATGRPGTRKSSRERGCSGPAGQ